jgi:hypothetical protein
MRELESNVALRVEETADADVFRVSGRGRCISPSSSCAAKVMGSPWASPACSQTIDGVVHEPAKR